jgi:hypothetical protein
MSIAIEAARIFVLYGLPALFVCGAVSLTALLLSRVKQLHEGVIRGEEELKSAKATWAQSLAAMGKEVEGIAEAARQPSPDPGASAVTRRKVLKMQRLGSSADQIAKALRLPKGEVMLLLKVHTIILRPFEQGADRLEFPEMEQKP